LKTGLPGKENEWGNLLPGQARDIFSCDPLLEKGHSLQTSDNDSCSELILKQVVGFKSPFGKGGNAIYGQALILG